MSKYFFILIALIFSFFIPVMLIAGTSDTVEREPWIEAYAGFGHYNWKLVYSSELSNDPAFNNTTQPFILKKFEVKTNLKIVQFGLNYFTNRFDNMLNTTEESDVARENDPLARQLALFAGLTLGRLVITTDVTFRKFQGTIHSNGISTQTAGRVPVKYYTSSGTDIDLQPGDEITWYSVVKDYLFKVGTPWRRKTGGSAAVEFGVRVVKYSSPTEFGITYNDPSLLSIDEVATALIVTNITQYFGGFSFWVNYTWTNGLYWEWYIPVYLGFSRAENAYVEMKPTSLSYTTSSMGRMAVGYQSGYLRLELGCDYNAMFSMSSSYQTKMKRDLPYYNRSDGSLETIDAGSEVNVSMGRLEIFWGIYAHATLML